MKKYILEAGIIFLFIIIGVGIVSDIDANSICNQEENAFEEKEESNEEVNDGNLTNIKVEKEDTSNLISSIVAGISNVVVKTLNLGLKIMVKIMRGIAN